MQAGTYFPKERMLLFDAPLISEHFWPASTLLRGHLAPATLSLPETDPQILEHWCYAHEVHLGKSVRAKDLVSNFSVTRNSLCECHTLDWFRHVIALPKSRLRRLHILEYATQLLCI